MTDPEKRGLRLNELRTWLKDIIYPDHGISNAFYNTKLQPKNNFSNMPYVTNLHKDTNNKIIMDDIKRNTGNTPSDYLRI